jgi:tyrosine-protein kinase Etk/Wzc
LINFNTLRNDRLQQSEFLFDVDDSISIKEYLSKILLNWKWYVVVILIFLTCAYAINRYSTPVFLVKGTLIINDEDKSMNAAVLEELSLVNSSVNIANEIGILNSHSLTRKIVDSLKLFISIYKLGNLKNTELYGIQAPIKIQILSDSNLIKGRNFNMSLVGENGFEIYFDDKDQNIQTIKGKFNPADTILMGDLSFMLLRNQKSTLTNGDFHLSFKSPDNYAKSLRKSIEITTMGSGSSILEISMQTSNKAKAQDIINTLMENYITRELNLKNQTAINTIEFIDEQLIEIKQELVFTETELEAFRSDNNILDISQEGMAVFNQLQELENQQSEIGVTLNYYNYLLEYIEKNPVGTLATPSTTGITDAGVNSLILELNNLNSQLIITESSGSEINPQVRILKKQIQHVLKSMYGNVSNIKNSVELQKEDLQIRINQVKKELRLLPGNERQLVNIQRRFSLNENLYVYLLEQKAEAGIVKASTVSSSEIIDNAMVYGQTSPKGLRNYAIAFVLGLMFPIIFITVKEFFISTVQNVQEVNKNSNIPVLSTIALSHRNTALVLQKYPRSAVAEGFRTLRANLKFFRVDEKKHQVIMITSFSSGDGKTFSSINTAIAMANSGKKTLLLELDLRKPKISEYLNLPNNQGVSDILIGMKKITEVTKETEVKNLSTITSGPLPPNPSDLLIMDSFSKIMSDLEKEYDCIIIDAPPIGLVSEPYEIAKYADLTLFVVRDRKTPSKSIEFLNDVSNKKLIDNVGIVYNGVDFSKTAGQYGYGYYAEDSHGYFEEEKKRWYEWS